MLPDWAPNVHPLVIHFPIALLFVAALVDAIALVVREKHPWVLTSAVGLYALGALGTAVAFLTGRDASDEVDLPAAAITTLNAHADWALYLVWFAGLYALVRVAALRYDRERRLAVHLPLAALGLVSLFFVQQTAERGGKMVYQYGVAVATVADPDASGEAMEGMEGMDHDAMMSAAPLDINAAGAFAWTDASGPFPADAQALSGTASGATLTAAPGRPTFIALGEAVGDLEAQARLDLSGFTGTAMLVHHVQGVESYDFLALDVPASGAATVRQGRVEDGAETTFDSGEADLSSPVDLKVYAVGTHFRGYVGGDQRTHGHGDAAPPGRVGLRLDGTGSARILALSATPVQ